MATPTLRILREYYGRDTQLIGIMRPYVAEVLTGTDWLSDVLPYDRRSANSKLGTVSLIRRMRQAKLDSVLLLTNSLRSAAIARVCQIPQRIGYVRYGRGLLLTERLYPPRAGFQLKPVSALDYYLHLAQSVGATIDSRRTELATTAADENRTDLIWKQLGFDSGRPVITLNTGGAYGSAKQWPLEYFATLATRLVRDLDAHVMVICGPSEATSAQRIVELANCDQVSSLADEDVSIGLSKAVVKRSNILVSTDSGPRHFGAAFNVPTISLFGPTDPRWSDNYHPHAIDVRRNVPCGPCAQRTCPLGHHRCMRELTVDQVFNATNHLLHTTQTSRHVA